MNRTILRPPLLGLALAGGLVIAGGQAQAAAPGETICRGVAPGVGQTVKGPILHVVDGERLCIALDASPANWVEVRILDAPLQKAAIDPIRSRGALMAAAFAQNAVCEIRGAADGVPVAECRVDGEPLAQRLASPDLVKIGQAWR